MATVRIPSPLRGFTRNQAEVRIPGDTVGEVLRNLERAHPGIGARLLDDRGGVRRYVNVFLNDEDIRFLQELSTPVAEGDCLTIIPAIAGG
jgi:sulfur-carrier protein